MEGNSTGAISKEALVMIGRNASTSTHFEDNWMWDESSHGTEEIFTTNQHYCKLLYALIITFGNNYKTNILIPLKSLKSETNR